jgi:hypothetical protein
MFGLAKSASASFRKRSAGVRELHLPFGPFVQPCAAQDDAGKHAGREGNSDGPG